MKKTTKALPIRLLLCLTLVSQLMLFAPTTKAAGTFPTSQCTGELTLTGRLGTIIKPISFILIGTFTGPFAFSYSALIRGITYSAAASGNCVAR